MSAVAGASIPRHSHMVQLAGGDEHALVCNVSRFLYEGLQQGERALVISNPQRIRAFADALEARGIDLSAACRTGDLIQLDAAEMLRGFIIDGQPEWLPFGGRVSAQFI